ncbi:MAG: response regulator [Candidatus Sungbacteria bacterium]|nr:response regulator [Candidatus Sungbacteria bacterium]
MTISKKRRKVLVVDDDQFISEMYVLKLRESGYEAESAADGIAALEKIKNNEPEVVLLDVVLPNMDGFDILKKLGEDNILKKTSVVLLSNLGEKKDIEKGLALGAIDYIVKAHFTPSEVVERVDKILNKEKKS